MSEQSWVDLEPERAWLDGEDDDDGAGDAFDPFLPTDHAAEQDERRRDPKRAPSTASEAPYTSQIDQLKHLKQQHVTAEHDLLGILRSAARKRRDVHAEAEARHEALRRELAAWFVQLLAQLEDEERALVAPIRTQLEHVRARIDEIDAARRALEAGLRSAADANADVEDPAGAHAHGGGGEGGSLDEAEGGVPDSTPPPASLDQLMAPLRAEAARVLVGAAPQEPRLAAVRFEARAALSRVRLVFGREAEENADESVGEGGRQRAGPRAGRAGTAGEAGAGSPAQSPGAQSPGAAELPPSYRAEPPPLFPPLAANAFADTPARSVGSAGAGWPVRRAARPPAPAAGDAFVAGAHARAAEAHRGAGPYSTLARALRESAGQVVGAACSGPEHGGAAQPCAPTGAAAAHRPAAGGTSIAAPSESEVRAAARRALALGELRGVRAEAEELFRAALARRRGSGSVGDAGLGPSRVGAAAGGAPPHGAEERWADPRPAARGAVAGGEGGGPPTVVVSGGAADVLPGGDGKEDHARGRVSVGAYFDGGAAEGRRPARAASPPASSAFAGRPDRSAASAGARAAAARGPRTAESESGAWGREQAASDVVRRLSRLEDFTSRAREAYG